VESLDLTAMNKPTVVPVRPRIPGDASERADLWLCHRRVFEPQAGACDLRFGGISLHRGERPPRPRQIATFRRRFLKEIEALFVEVLKLAGEIGVLKLGTVALDGTKIHANAAATVRCRMSMRVR